MRTFGGTADLRNNPANDLLLRKADISREA